MGICQELEQDVKGIGHQGPGGFVAGGPPVCCPHCQAVHFIEGSALLSTGGLSFARLEWATEKKVTTLMCDNCGLIQWFGIAPQNRLSGPDPAREESMRDADSSVLGGRPAEWQGGCVEMDLLVPSRHLAALEVAANCRGLTAAQFLRHLIRDRLAGLRDDLLPGQPGPPHSVSAVCDIGRVIDHTEGYAVIGTPPLGDGLRSQGVSQ